jgi:hypothetical protein
LNQSWQRPGWNPDQSLITDYRLLITNHGRARQGIEAQGQGKQMLAAIEKAGLI